MKKSVNISELRRLVRDVLVEVLSEEDVEDPNNPNKKTVVKAPGQPASPTGQTTPAPNQAQAVAKTMPSPGAPPPPQASTPPAAPQRQTIGARDVNQVIANQNRPTVPAAKSNAEQSMDQQFRKQGTTSTGQPTNTPAFPPKAQSPSAQKISMVSKSLTGKGAQFDPQALSSYINSMSPTDAMVKTTEQIAADFLKTQQNAQRA